MRFFRAIDCSVYGSKEQSTKEINGAPPATVVLVQTGIDVIEWHEKVIATEERQ